MYNETTASNSALVGKRIRRATSEVFGATAPVRIEMRRKEKPPNEHRSSITDRIRDEYAVPNTIWPIVLFALRRVGLFVAIYLDRFGSSVNVLVPLEGVLP